MGHIIRQPDHHHVPDLTQLVVDDETDGTAPCAICGIELVAEGPYSADTDDAFVLMDGKRLLRIRPVLTEPRADWARLIAAFLNFAHAEDDEAPGKPAIDPLGTTQVHP